MELSFLRARALSFRVVCCSLLALALALDVAADAERLGDLHVLFLIENGFAHPSSAPMRQTIENIADELSSRAMAQASLLAYEDVESLFDKRAQPRVFVDWTAAKDFDIPPEIWIGVNGNTSLSEGLAVARGKLNDVETPDARQCLVVLTEGWMAGSARIEAATAINELDEEGIRLGMVVYNPYRRFFDFLDTTLNETMSDNHAYWVRVPHETALAHGSIEALIDQCVGGIGVSPPSIPSDPLTIHLQTKRNEPLILAFEEHPLISSYLSDLSTGMEKSIKTIEPPIHGTLGCSDEDFACTYRPDLDFVGHDAFTVWVSEDPGMTLVFPSEITLKFALEVIGTTHLLQAHDDFAHTTQDEAVRIDVLANDVFQGEVDVVLEAQAAHGLASCLRGSCTYLPHRDHVGEDTFRYRITETATGHRSSAAVNIGIVPKPVESICPDKIEIEMGAEQDSVEIPLPDGDVRNSTEAVVDVSQPSHGRVECSEDGCIYERVDGFEGTVRFTFTFEDGTGRTCVIDVVIKVERDNHPPLKALDDSFVLDLDQTQVLDVLANDLLPADGALKLRITREPQHGQAQLEANGIAYTPDSGFLGEDRLGYEVCFRKSSCAAATVTLSIETDEHLIKHTTQTFPGKRLLAGLTTEIRVGVTLGYPVMHLFLEETLPEDWVGQDWKNVRIQRGGSLIDPSKPHSMRTEGNKIIVMWHTPSADPYPAGTEFELIYTNHVPATLAPSQVHQEYAFWSRVSSEPVVQSSTSEKQSESQLRSAVFLEPYLELEEAIAFLDMSSPQGTLPRCQPDVRYLPACKLNLNHDLLIDTRQIQFAEALWQSQLEVPFTADGTLISNEAFGKLLCHYNRRVPITEDCD